MFHLTCLFHEKQKGPTQTVNHQKLPTCFQVLAPQPKRHRLKPDNYYVLPIKKCALQGFMSPVITMRKLGKYLTVPGPSEPEGHASTPVLGRYVM